MIEVHQFACLSDNYGFSTLFTWIADRFGVSWQLNLPVTQGG